MRAATAPRVAVDTRWRQTSGIARYSREVLARLTTPWTPLVIGGAPQSPVDALRRSSRAQRELLVYNPGFNARLERSRQLITLHDLIHLRGRGPRAAAHRLFYERVVRRTVRTAGSLFTVSEESAVDITEWLGGDVPVVVTGNGVSDRFLDHAPAAGNRYDYVLFVGNLKAHKNLPVAVEAARRIGARIVVVCADTAGVAALAGRLGAQDNVVVAGGLDDGELADLYGGAALTVMPSSAEGFGLPAVESLACGTPVAYWSGCGSLRRLVGEHGTAVDSHDDVPMWAGAMEAALARPRRVTVPDLAARHGWPVVAARIDDHLSAVLAGNVHE